MMGIYRIRRHAQPWQTLPLDRSYEIGVVKRRFRLTPPNFLVVILLFLTSHCLAQTYWLKNFAPSNPKKPPIQLKVTPPNPSDLEQYPDHIDAPFITIDGENLIVNDYTCLAKLRTPDRSTRIQFDNWEEVEEIGGYAKFRQNLISNLRSDPESWTKPIWMTEVKSAKPDHTGECGLFSGTRKIYFGKDDVIIPQPFHGYYRYVKGPGAVLRTTWEESERKKIRAGEETQKLEDRLLKGPKPNHLK